MIRGMTGSMSKAFYYSGLVTLVCVLILAFALPVFAQGTTPTNQLVPCRGLDCQMCYLVELAQRIIRFLIIIAAPIAALLFAWAGVLYFSATGSEENVGKAKEIFTNAFVGFVIALSAYLIVEVIIRTLIRPEAIGNWNTVKCSTNRLGTTLIIPSATVPSGTVVGAPATRSSSPMQDFGNDPVKPAPTPQKTQDVNDSQPGAGVETGTTPTPKPPQPSSEPLEVSPGGTLSP